MDLYAYEDRLYFSETGVDDNETYIAALDCTDLITGETVEKISSRIVQRLRIAKHM